MVMAHTSLKSGHLLPLVRDGAVKDANINLDPRDPADVHGS